MFSNPVAGSFVVRSSKLVQTSIYVSVRHDVIKRRHIMGNFESNPIHEAKTRAQLLFTGASVLGRSQS